MSIVTAITLTLSISAYAPGANRISGGRVMSNGEAPFAGAFACPSWIPFGTRVAMLGAARDRATMLGLPTDGICADHFAKRYSTGYLDICIPYGYDGMTNQERLRTAYRWGRIRGDVQFTQQENTTHGRN